MSGEFSTPPSPGPSPTPRSQNWMFLYLGAPHPSIRRGCESCLPRPRLGASEAREGSLLSRSSHLAGILHSSTRHGPRYTNLFLQLSACSTSHESPITSHLFGPGTTHHFLCFQSLPTMAICNSFVFIFLQQWGGGVLRFSIFAFRLSLFSLSLWAVNFFRINTYAEHGEAGNLICGFFQLSTSQPLRLCGLGAFRFSSFGFRVSSFQFPGYAGHSSPATVFGSPRLWSVSFPPVSLLEQRRSRPIHGCAAANLPGPG